MLPKSFKTAFQVIGILIWKDLLIDLRRKENFLSMLFFSIITLLIFYFAFGEQDTAIREAVPGVFWVTFLLAGVLGLNKAQAQEVENGNMGGLLLTPTDRSLIFLGKALSSLLSLLLLQSLMVPIVLLLFNLWVHHWMLLVLCILGGTLGFAFLGTLLTSLTAALHGKELLLPLLLFPLMIPSLLSVVHITSLALKPSDPSYYNWMALLIGFDIIVGVFSLLGFELIVEA